jgi:hypothetical protein
VHDHVAGAQFLGDFHKHSNGWAAGSGRAQAPGNGAGDGNLCGKAEGCSELQLANYRKLKVRKAFYFIAFR